jgi:hypothetical protein
VAFSDETPPLSQQTGGKGTEQQNGNSTSALWVVIHGSKISCLHVFYRLSSIDK